MSSSSPSDRSPWRLRDDGIEIAIRAIPRARRETLGPILTAADGSVVVAARITAPAEGGRANDALRRLLADAIGVPQSRITLLSGATSRHKRVHVAGSPQELATTLAAILAAASETPS